MTKKQSKAKAAQAALLLEKMELLLEDVEAARQLNRHYRQELAISQKVIEDQAAEIVKLKAQAMNLKSHMPMAALREYIEKYGVD